MEHRVSRFAHKLLPSAGRSGQHDLYGFLPEFSGSPLAARRQQLCRPGLAGVGPPPFGDHLRQALQNVQFSLTGMPASSMCSLTDLIDNSPKWNTEAANTAEAPPTTTPSTK